MLFPVIALAQFGQIDNFVYRVITFINQTLVPLVFAIAFLVFLWGIFKYFILGGHDETKRREGKQLMLWAIIGFVLMISLWGIVNVVAAGFGFGGARLQNLPTRPLPRGSTYQGTTNQGVINGGTDTTGL